MIGFLIGLLVVLALVVLAVFYILLLDRLCPEQMRTNEVFYLRTRDLWLLRVCRYRKSETPGEPVLLVHGMGANQNNFTFPPNGCLVDYLSAEGYDCWTLDLRGCRSSEPPFERTRNEVCMEDFFMEDLPAVVRHILKTTGHPKLHWVGHSMGGMLLYAFVQAHGPELLASGTTLGSPIDFNDAAGNVPLWLVRFGEKCPRLAGNIIRGAIPVLKGLHLPVSAFPVNMRNLPPAMGTGHFVNMIEDPLPKLMSQVRHWIKNKEYTLLDGKLDIAAGLPDFPLPLLAFYAAVDPFIKAPRALEFFNNIHIKDKRAFVCGKKEGYIEDYGHCDLAFGKAAKTEIFEPILHWLKEHPCSADSKKGKESKVHLTVHSSPIADKVATAELKTAAAPAVEEPPVQHAKAKAKAKTKAKTKAVSTKKAAPRQKTPAKAKSSVAKRTAATKPKAKPKASPAVKKAAAPKKPAAAPVQKSDSPSVPFIDGLEIDPEALARAEAIRTARNRAFSEIEALLDDTPKQGKPKRS
ncbi:MAG: alpha/beta hydrolase [Candidatus Hydrogenedentes bacterium]|nr:alpha/beta hydrolase [Candidatus Hydrogenedentota bacterium]